MSVRYKVATISSATMIAAGMGAVVFAAPASAVNNTTLCAKDGGGVIQCAVDTPLVSGTFVAMKHGQASLVNVPSSSGQISTTNGLCFTIDTGASNRIHLEVCSGAADAEWTASSISGGTQYKNPHTGLCLNDHYQVGQLNATTCNKGTDQAFSAAG